MSSKIERMKEAFLEGAKGHTTWSGIPVKTHYTAQDLSGLDLESESPPPGTHPYTRGIHEDLYRGKYWTRREVCGYGMPEDTNARFKFLIDEGVTGLNVIIDVPTSFGIDPDHPKARGEVGMSGANFSTIADMERIMEDIPLDKVNMSLITASAVSPVILAQYLAVARQRGIEPEGLNGTIQNDPLHTRYCGHNFCMPVDLCLKANADIVEYCTHNMPRWYTMNVNLYDMREQGLDAAQEIGIGFSFAMLYMNEARERGLKVDAFAPRMAFYCSAHIDFFEEIAKYRAARKIWARLMQEKYGAQDPRSLRFRFGVHTAGCSLVPQQPLNNITRIGFEALAAVLGGAQSIHCCSYDEPIALPTEESQRIALRTQQIIAYETGVANVTDPLGGSYYIEALTQRVEEAAERVLEEIDDLGGMVKAMESGWLDDLIGEMALKHQRKVEERERIVVGQNAFRIPEKEEPLPEVHRVSPEVAEKKAAEVRKLRKERDAPRARQALEGLCQKIRMNRKATLIPEMVEAVTAHVTLGEIMGAVRREFGHPYDPFGILEGPAL
jgi:methylmalonyl-CoA mutase N-terminal domain/subunit